MEALELSSLAKLQSAGQMELLDVVDSLRACGLNEIIGLPQLIVTGDQSCGKSSVLEAISGIPFPRQDDLCTRFATEVILRREPKEQITVSIIPGKTAKPAEREKTKSFHHNLQSKKDFEGLFDIATDAMGISASGRTFSDDILRVELCGPSQPQLTLVDLPGLIHTATKTQNNGDVELVNNLVSGYLNDPRSIILAVVSAKNDINNQIILRKAREVDPEGLRTFGIITKPDLLVKRSKSERNFIALARNENIRFDLGWHVVRNVDSALLSQQIHTRDQQETDFFQESNFSCLPFMNVGVNFLRIRLNNILFNQIRKELPRVVKEIQGKISIAKEGCNKLGKGRQTIEDQRRFLISLSQTFHDICRDAAKGDYEHAFFQVNWDFENRLCANVMNKHFEFANNLRQNGSFWLVDGDVNDPRYRTYHDAIEEACTLLKRGRGRELPGLPNPLVVGELFREYSKPWGELARQHISDVWESTILFIQKLLRYITDVNTSENVFQYWLSSVMEEKLDLSYRKLDELLEIHKEFPMTTNNDFMNRIPRADNIDAGDESTDEDSDDDESVDEDRVDNQIAAVVKKHFSRPGNKTLNVNKIDRYLSTRKHRFRKDMDKVAAEEAFQTMTAYYDVALNLFTDNVPTLVIQATIIRDIPNIFCPEAVYSMDDDMVKLIAGETEVVIEQRATLLRRLDVLEKGAHICKRYAKLPHFFVTGGSDKIRGLSSINRQEPIETTSLVPYCPPEPALDTNTVQITSTTISTPKNSSSDIKSKKAASSVPSKPEPEGHKSKTSNKKDSAGEISSMNPSDNPASNLPNTTASERSTQVPSSANTNTTPIAKSGKAATSRSRKEKALVPPFPSVNPPLDQTTNNPPGSLFAPRAETSQESASSIGSPFVPTGSLFGRSAFGSAPANVFKDGTPNPFAITIKHSPPSSGLFGSAAGTRPEASTPAFSELRRGEFGSKNKSDNAFVSGTTGSNNGGYGGFAGGIVSFPPAAGRETFGGTPIFGGFIPGNVTKAW